MTQALFSTMQPTSTFSRIWKLNAWLIRQLQPREITDVAVDLQHATAEDPMIRNLLLLPMEPGLFNSRGITTSTGTTKPDLRATCSMHCSNA